jgi:hypothetical protein
MSTIHAIYRKSPVTRFTAVRITCVDDAMEHFGNYTDRGETPLMCMPDRSSCKPWLMIPEGTYAVVTSNGRFVGIWAPGIHFCMPWTKIQYLITHQSVVFDLPIRNCPNVDKIFITVSEMTLD